MTRRGRLTDRVRPGRRRREDRLPVTRTEPAMVRGVVVSLVSLLASLGVSWAADLSAKEVGALATAAVTVVPILQAVWTRYGVVARDLVLARLSARRGVVVAGEAAAYPTGEPLPAAGGDRGAPVVQVELDPTLPARRDPLA